MARSSYAESRSRTSVIFWSSILFILGIALLSGVVGFIGPMILNDTGMPVSLEKKLTWSGATASILLGMFIVKLILTGNDGNRIAASMGGTFIDPMEAPEIFEDRAHNRRIEAFLHYVETCAVAAGMSEVPNAYIVFDEEAINAFAAGSGPGKSVVAITEAALLSFDDAELEGVVGHEIAHITQGDTAFATRIVALCVVLMIAAEVGWFLARIRGGRDNRLAMFGLAIAVTGIVGTLCARLMQAFVSRQAEYRADASGALYAGTPSGLVSALRKIESMNTGEVGTKIPPAYSHMLLAPPGATMGLAQRISSLAFSTHPATDKRIAALEGEVSPAEPAAETEDSPFAS